MANALKSLRLAVWGADGKVKPQDIGEALRDLFTALKLLTAVRVVRFERFVWAPPFFIQSDTQPAAVILGNARVSQQPTVATVANVPFTYLNQQVRIDAIPGLTTGTAYDLSFVVIG